MDRAHLRQVLSGLGCGKISEREKNISANCPFARFTHKDFRDRHPSFSIEISEPGQGSRYHCFACGESGGSVKKLCRRLQSLGMLIPPEILRLVEQHEGEALRVSSLETKYRTLDQFAPVAVEPDEVLSEEELAPFSGRVPRYVLDRGITLESCKLWDLGYHKEEGKVVIPVRRSADKALVGVMTRTIFENQRPKYLPMIPFKKSRYLYGEHLASVADQMLVVEGFFDAIWLRQCGFDAVAVMGAEVSAIQAEKLLSMKKPIVLALDWDVAGLRGMAKAVHRLKNRCLLKVAWPAETCACGDFRLKLSSSGREILCRKCGAARDADSGSYKQKDFCGMDEDSVRKCIERAETLRFI